MEVYKRLEFVEINRFVRLYDIVAFMKYKWGDMDNSTELKIFVDKNHPDRDLVSLKL